MRLVAKHLFLLMVGVTVVLLLDGYLAVNRELKLFDADMRRDARRIAGILRAALRDAWVARGEEAALELVRHANEQAADIEVRWVWLDRDAPAEYRPLAPPENLAPLAQGKTVVAALPHDGEEGYLYTYAPVRIPVGPPRIGAIEIAESLAAKHDYTSTSATRIGAAMVATVAVCALLALILGIWAVGNPVQKLVAHARAVGSGQLGRRVRLSQRDELGMLANELNAMTERLEVSRRQLVEQTEQRSRAVEELRHADRLTTVGKLASGVAHELGTPLSVVAQRAAMIARGEIIDSDAAENAKIIGGQAERMTTIIKALLDFSRRRTPKTEVHDLAALARQTLELLQPIGTRRGVELHLADEDGKVEAQIDVGQIRQALTNLVTNAIDACKQGGAVTVGVGHRSATRDAEDETSAVECAYLSVEDTGDGVGEKERSLIFDPFFTTKAVGEGTGLGLPIARGIVHDHGGWITVAKSSGGGACFTITIPLGDVS